MIIDDRPDLLRELHTWMGRCLLVSQACELQMKSLLAIHQIEGHLSESPEKTLQSSRERLSGHTLGRAKEELFAGFLRACDAPMPDVGAAKGSMPRPAVVITNTIHLPADARAALKALMDSVTDRRNRLVHNLIEESPLNTAEGCSKAVAHLRVTFADLQALRTRLKDITVETTKIQAAASAFLNSPEAVDLIDKGGFLRQAHQHRFAGATAALRRAHEAVSVDGWARLSEAVDFIRQHQPDQSPKTYECKSWRQVVHETRTFQLQLRPALHGPKEPWYAERHGKATPSSQPLLSL